jgi:hypothetical protein
MPSQASLVSVNAPSVLNSSAVHYLLPNINDLNVCILNPPVVPYDKYHLLLALDFKLTLYFPHISSVSHHQLCSWRLPVALRSFTQSWLCVLSNNSVDSAFCGLQSHCQSVWSYKSSHSLRKVQQFCFSDLVFYFFKYQIKKKA